MSSLSSFSFFDRDPGRPRLQGDHGLAALFVKFTLIIFVLLTLLSLAFSPAPRTRNSGSG